MTPPFEWPIEPLSAGPPTAEEIAEAEEYVTITETIREPAKTIKRYSTAEVLRREEILRRNQEGQPKAAIAKAMGLPRKTVYNVIYRAENSQGINTQPEPQEPEKQAKTGIDDGSENSIARHGDPSLLTNAAKAEIREALRSKKIDWDALTNRDWPLKWKQGTMRLTKNDLHNVAVMG
jgi:hypothetical protein